MELPPELRSSLLDRARKDGALPLIASDPEQRTLIRGVLAAAGKGPDRYPALHRAIDDAAAGNAAPAPAGLDDCTIVDMGKDGAGRATARGWLACRGGAYICTASTFLLDTDSGEQLAAGTATAVRDTLAQAATVSAQARPATQRMTAVTVFHAQRSPQEPPRFGLVAATRETVGQEVHPTVLAPQKKDPPAPPLDAVKIGLCRDDAHLNRDCDYWYHSVTNPEVPNRLVAPFVGSIELMAPIDTGRQIVPTTKIFVKSALAWRGLMPGFVLSSGWQIDGSVFRWSYPADGLPIEVTKSIQYEPSQQARDTRSAFFFQFIVPVIGSPSVIPFTVCSYNTPDEPSINCTNVKELEYWWHCLGEDTAVTLADGSERAIRDIDNTVQVRTGLGDELAEVQATARALHGEEPALRLTTETGLTLLLSAEHPVITPTGPISAADLQVGQPLLTRDGADRVRSCAPERYDGLVYNLEVAAGSGGFGSFLANGVRVGDQHAQAAHWYATSHDPDYMLARLPESHHQDYLSALADSSPR